MSASDVPQPTRDIAMQVSSVTAMSNTHDGHEENAVSGSNDGMVLQPKQQRSMTLLVETPRGKTASTVVPVHLPYESLVDRLWDVAVKRDAENDGDHDAHDGKGRGVTNDGSVVNANSKRMLDNTMGINQNVPTSVMKGAQQNEAASGLPSSSHSSSSNQCRRRRRLNSYIVHNGRVLQEDNYKSLFSSDNTTTTTTTTKTTATDAAVREATESGTTTPMGSTAVRSAGRVSLRLRLLGGIDRQNRVGSKFGGGGVSSSQNAERERKERLKQLALESIDLANDPYLFKNHLGLYECKLCLTQHPNEANYLAHTQGKKHQKGLAYRAHLEKLKAQKEATAQMSAAALAQQMQRKPAAQLQKSVKIGRPAYQVLKSRDVDTDQRCLSFEVSFPEIQAGLQPRHRFMSAFEQKIDTPPDRRYQYLLVAAEPYETVAFKIPNEPIDKGEGRFVTHWDNAQKKLTLTLYFMNPVDEKEDSKKDDKDSKRPKEEDDDDEEEQQDKKRKFN